LPIADPRVAEVDPLPDIRAHYLAGIGLGEMALERILKGWIPVFRDAVGRTLGRTAILRDHALPVTNSIGVMDSGDLCVLPETALVLLVLESWTASMEGYLPNARFRAATAVHPRRAVERSMKIGRRNGVPTKRCGTGRI
jgi:hypothetical protein